MSYGVAFPTTGSPYRAASSLRSVSPVHQQPVQIQPGSITYTTTTTSDGRIQYNTFRAESRSYQTAQGLVHGIQWIPVNLSHELPSNAQLAGPDFHASWSRPNDKETQRALKEWQHEQEKRVKKEEKESAKRMKEWERERREREKAEDKELRKMQDRDLQRGGRPRRLSEAGYGPDLAYAPPVTVGYSRARSRSRVRRDSAGQDEITRAMAEMAMDHEWSESDLDGRRGERERRNSNVTRAMAEMAMDHEWSESDLDGRRGERERRNSNVGRSRKISISERPRRLSTNEYERARKNSGTPYSTYLAGAQPAYGAPPSPGRVPYSDRMSPYMGGGSLPSPGMTVPVYPPGHIYAGKPIPGMQGNNVMGSYRAPSPLPRHSSMPLELPVAFTRPPSLAVPYTYFDTIRIISDLNNLFKKLPHMPPVLAPHDVWPEDWIRCFEDLARTWVGKWPDRNKSSKRPQKVVAELIDVWNASFFSLRGVELILYRGRQRLSGPHAGRYDNRLGNDDISDDESDTISSVSSDSDVEDRYEFYGSSQARYGNWLADSREAHRARKARKLVEKQKKRKRRERERGNESSSRYAIYLTCISDGQPRFTYPPVGYPS